MMRATAQRTGAPDRSRSGSARRLDRKLTTAAKLREQVGFLFRDRLSIPAGTTAGRPAEPEHDIRCNETTGRFEGYCDGKWQSLSSGIDQDQVAVVFTAIGQYIHPHGKGVEPQVTVLDSTGKQIEVSVLHLSTDVVQLDFYGTLTDAVLLID